MTTDQFGTPLQFSNNYMVTIVQFNLVFLEERTFRIAQNTIQFIKISRWVVQLVALFPGTFCKTVISHLKAAPINELKFSHNVASTAGKYM